MYIWLRLHSQLFLKMTRPFVDQRECTRYAVTAGQCALISWTLVGNLWCRQAAKRPEKDLKEKVACILQIFIIFQRFCLLTHSISLVLEPSYHLFQKLVPRPFPGESTKQRDALEIYKIILSIFDDSRYSICAFFF